MLIEHIKDLKPDRRNARKHNPRNIDMLTRSLQEVGAARSIVIDEDDNSLPRNLYERHTSKPHAANGNAPCSGQSAASPR